MTKDEAIAIADNWLHRSGWEGRTDVEDAVRQFVFERPDTSAGWEAACRETIQGSADDRDRSIALAGLLGQARAFVSDALEAHEHSDGRELLTKIDTALRPYTRTPSDHEKLVGELVEALALCVAELEATDPFAKELVAKANTVLAKAPARQVVETLGRGS